MESTGLAFGPFVFDPARGLLKRDGVELSLPPRVLGVLEVLLRRPGHVIPRQELMETVWKDAFVTDTSLAEAVSVLRQTLGDDAQTPVYIQTLHRRGYRFVAPVAETGSDRIQTGVIPRSDPARAEGTPVSGANEAAAATVSPSIAGQLLPWSVAVVCAILAAIAVREAVRDSDAALPPVSRFSVAPAAGTRFDASAPALALSPDGSTAAWSACDASGCRLYLRPAARLDATPVARTDGAAAPFFSPDGRWIGFFADGRLKKVGVAGGAPVTLADAADALGAVWTRDNSIIYAGAAPGLTIVRDTGGEPIPLTTPSEIGGEVRHAWPSLHPDQDLLFFTVTGAPETDAGGRLAVLSLDDRRRAWTTLLEGIGAAAPVAHDVLVFSSGSDLHAVGFDSRRGAIAGAPQSALSGLAVSHGAGQFAVSSAGALIAAPAAAAPERSSFFWWTPAALGKGESQIDAARVRSLDGVALSPDGRRAAGVDRADGMKPDVWVTDLERGTAARLTHAGTNAAPVWSPDGTRIFYGSSDGGVFAIYVRDADASRPATRVHAAAAHAFPSSVAADGSLLAFVSHDPRRGMDVWGLPLAGGPIHPLIHTAFDETAAVFSPDARLIAYQSNESGRWEIYVLQRADGRRTAVSTDGGTQPFWSPDGRTLFFRSADRVMRAAVAADGSITARPDILTRSFESLAIGADSTGRLLFQRRSRTPSDAAVLTLHWIREARQLLGPPSAAMPR